MRAGVHSCLCRVASLHAQGKYKSFAGLGTCPNCPPGNYSAVLGSSACSLCWAGRFGATSGQTTSLCQGPCQVSLRAPSALPDLTVNLVGQQLVPSRQYIAHPALVSSVHYFWAGVRSAH